MKTFHNAVYFAWADTKARYKKSTLGPFWPTLANLLGVLGLSLVWGHLMNQDMAIFVPQLSAGLITWQLISGVLVDGPVCFSRQAALIRNVAVPSWFFSARLLARHLINLMHNAVIVVGVMVYFGVPLHADTWQVLPGVLLLILNLFWILHLFGLLGARFRDIEHLVAGVVPMLFFISPVIYRVNHLPPSLHIAWLNPFTYMIEAIRAPLLGYPAPPETWMVLGSMLLVGGGLTVLAQQHYGKNLAFWV